ncbi:MAG: FG-GAP repeat domain-containing protein [Candidatus Hydrogenedentota bacterium]
MRFSIAAATLLALAATGAVAEDPDFTRVPYNNPGLVVDLGVGLWAQPLPMDADGDEDHDLVVATADTPYNGIYLFENTDGDVLFPVFRPGVRLGGAKHNITVSYADGERFVMSPGRMHPNFVQEGLDSKKLLTFKPEFHMGRAKQFKRVDYDGDGVIDLIIGTSDWRDYGWDQAFNEEGVWTNGPLHGYVYFIKNTGTNDKPDWAEPVQLEAGGEILDVYGAPSPNFADWDGDGDLDLICGEFLDKITYFENIGSRTDPEYAAGRYLTHEGETIRMELQMLQVIAFDWDKDGDDDLIVGQEDGRVALMECVGVADDAMPQFLPPRFFEQEAENLKVGALATPYAFDWDNDGDLDLIVGDTAGFISFVENLGGDGPLPKWAPPVRLEAGGEVLRIQAGPNGSVQGPAEAKWGYTVVNVADWNHDGRQDLVVNSIWGAVLWYENVGTRERPRLGPAQRVEVAWEDKTPKPPWVWWEPVGKQLVTQWRTTPCVIDLNEDGLNDLVMLDTEGYLAFYERRKVGEDLQLLPPQRIFRTPEGDALRMDPDEGGKSGRRKFCFADWDGDGRLDILANSQNVEFLRNVGDGDQPWVFRNMGDVSEQRLAGHTTCPTTVDWNQDGNPDLLIGAEDGHFYYMKNPHP